VRTHLLSGLGAGFVLMAAVACGGSSATNPPVSATTAPVATQAPAASVAAPASAAAAAAPTCGGSSGQAVGIANFSFSPGTISVSSGSTVTWTNSDSATHTVTFDNGPDCGQVASGSSVTASLSGPGSYSYHCKIHPQMKGTVTVS